MKCSNKLCSASGTISVLVNKESDSLIGEEHHYILCADCHPWFNRYLPIMRWHHGKENERNCNYGSSIKNGYNMEHTCHFETSHYWNMRHCLEQYERINK